MSEQRLDFWDAVDRIREAEPRYRREAYAFVVAALGVAAEALPDERRRDENLRHLTGRELLEGVVGLARREFGPMAPMVFREWGVEAGEDVGRIVFALVRAEQLRARPEDTMQDFEGFDLMEALAAGHELGAGRASSPGPRRRIRPGSPSSGAG